VCICLFIIIIIIIIIIIQQAVQSVHIFLRPFINYEYIIFFLQLCLSFQSSFTNPFLPLVPNPFLPGEFRSFSFSTSWWTPFHNFFW
jgi:hypothetical protein